MKSIKNKVVGIGVILFIFFLSSCAEPQTQEIELSFNAEAVGPFFQGTNSLVAEKEINLGELLDNAEINSENIESIIVSNAVINLENQGFENFTSASISLVSKNSPMKSIAILNPVKSDGTTATLVTSDEADVADIMKEGKFSLIADLDFKEDDYSEKLEATINLTLILTY